MRPLEELAEADLVRAAKSGTDEGRQAYSELVRRHQAWLIRLISQLMRIPTTEAEDLAQEAFVRTFAAIDRLPDDVSFRAWIRVVATRLAFNARRNRMTRDRIQDTLPPPATAQGGDSLAARDALDHVLGELSYPYREILLLRFVEELPIEEIARTLNIGLSAAKMRLKRAREAFMERYDAITEDS